MVCPQCGGQDIYRTNPGEMALKEMEPCHKSAGNSCDHSHHEEATDETVRVQDHLSHIRHKLIVMSGKGGVGKSSVATYLAIGLGRLGCRVGLLDMVSISVWTSSMASAGQLAKW
jgi:Mrp family chromosome partitioning ATPase